MPTLAPFPTRRARRGMVCSVDHLASAAGLSLLRAGGNAVDAAIGANAVLAVTSQHMCGMGGDLFALVHTEVGPPAVLNASGRAGSGADAQILRDEGHDRMPPRGDIRTVTIPGCVDGWMALHQRFGRLDLAQVLEPARSYAADGFPASPSLAAAVAGIGDLDGAEDYRQAPPLDAGDLVRRPGVARALADIASGGREAWYGGEFGSALVEMGRGQYRTEDLAASQAEWVEPLGMEAWGHTLWTVPPNSQGYLILGGAFMASRIGLPDDPDDPAWAHLTIEAARQAGYDRLDVLHEHADGAALLDPSMLEERMARIDPQRAVPLGSPAAAGDTTALCAADAEGMGVSLIQSNAAGFGAHLVVPGPRVFLQNRGVGFSLEPGHPAELGPGRRPPHTLAPSLVTTPDGRLALLAATEGGDMQPHVLLQLLARVLGAGQSPAAAIAAGRWTLHAREGEGFDLWRESGRVVVHLEGQTPSTWAETLTARGHAVERRPAWGRVGLSHLLSVADGLLSGASDPRHSESAVAAW